METEPTQSTSGKKPKWCQCGAQPPHQRRTAKQCLYNKNRVRVDDNEQSEESVEPERTEKFTINIGLDTICKYDVVKTAIKEAVRRTSIIRFEANKLAQLYVIMNANNFDAMMSIPRNKHPLHLNFYQDCHQAVSRLDARDQPDNVDDYLMPAWNIYTRISGNQPWTSRSGLVQVLTFAAGEDARTSATNVFVHFKTRLTRFIWLQLSDIDGMTQLVGYSGIKKLAAKMVDTL